MILLLTQRSHYSSLSKTSSLLHLTPHLTTKIGAEYFELEDYKIRKEQLVSLCDKLKDNDLSINALKLISILSGATTVDEEGSYKITQQGYKKILTMKKELGIQSSTEFPDDKTILSNIQEKKGIILTPSQQAPDAFVPIAHLSHRTFALILPDEQNNKIIRSGLPTSTKDDHTIQIDKYQQTNLDINKQNKDQMFRPLTTFIYVDPEKESITVDVAMTLYFRGVNSDNKDITEILVNAFEKTKPLWANNPYQFTYTADKEFIRNLTTVFLKEKLDLLEQKEKELNDKLDNLRQTNLEGYKEALKKGHAEKEKKKQEREDQLYYSLLPEHLQKLELSVQKFEEIMKKNEVVNKNKEQKKEIEKVAILFKEKQKAEKTELTTASHKKKDYLKKKEQERENYVKKDT